MICVVFRNLGLVQDCSISIASALEILQSCSKPLIWSLLPGDYKPIDYYSSAVTDCKRDTEFQLDWSEGLVVKLKLTSGEWHKFLFDDLEMLPFRDIAMGAETYLDRTYWTLWPVEGQSLILLCDATISLRRNGVADDLVPHRRQTISNHHADSIMTIVLHESYHVS